MIVFEGQHNQISGNSMTDTGRGFPEAGGFGVILDGADDNLVYRNVMVDGKGPAIFVTSLESQGTSDGNTVSYNVARSRLSDGILVNSNASATILNHNTVNGNGYDGIQIDAPGTIVTGNTANANHNLGIEAVPTVIDGGKNRASGNGDPAQCLNVVCN